ncbi:MAG: hypothetical protein N2643_01030 [Endomicrobia bacterium]|nr:hypothetical protein [Endomicrobiia bacterium]
MKKYFIKSTFFLFIICSNIFSIKTEILNYKIYKTDNFDIYYSHKKLEPILPLTKDILEKALAEHSEFFAINFNNKIPFFIYYGYKQFLQNTIVDVTEGTGGVTEAFKNRLLIPYTGSMKFLQHVINHEFIHEVEFNILYSGVWKTPLLLKSIFYPHWLMEGLAEYRAAIYTKTLQEMLVRDMALSNNLIPLLKLHNFSHLKPHMILPAYEQSAKLMEFIEKEYGKEKLVYLLKVFKEKFESNSVLNLVLGIDLKKLEKLFFEEMSIQYNYEMQISSMYDLNYNKRVTKKEIYPVHYYSPILYKNKIIFLGDPDGELNFYSYDIKSNKLKKLIANTILRRSVDIIQRDYNRISISANGNLCFIGLKNNKNYIYIYNINTKKLQKIKFEEKVDILISCYINQKGDKIYFSGLKDSKSIIFYYDIKSKKVIEIKQDENFISEISSSQDEKKLIYTKEQSCRKGIYETWQTDIFLYNLETLEEKNLTNTVSDENFGLFLSENEIIFISDYNVEYNKKFYGVKNLFTKNIEDGKMKQITNVIGGIMNYFVDKDNIVLSYYRNFDQHIYYYNLDDFNFNNNVVDVIEVTNTQSREEISETKSYLDNLDNRKIIPYRFSFSTDLFFPFLYYSSYEGLMMLLYWQGSDMVGEHNIGLNSIVMGEDNYVVNFEYRFRKFRPTFILSITGQSAFDYIDKLKEKYLSLITGFIYPLSTISSVGFLVGYDYLDSLDSSGVLKIRRENIIYCEYERSTIVGKFLEPLYGSYLSLSYQISDKIIDGNMIYRIYKGNYTKYFHLGKEYGIFGSLRTMISEGNDKNYFNIGGPERVAGIWYGDKTSYEVYLFRLGWRLPLVYDINYYMWFMFPDLFLKGLYSEIFIDGALDARLNFYKSFGIKFKLYTFVLQSYVLKFELIFAKEFERDKKIISYFNIGGGF